MWKNVGPNPAFSWVKSACFDFSASNFKLQSHILSTSGVAQRVHRGPGHCKDKEKVVKWMRRQKRERGGPVGLGGFQALPVVHQVRLHHCHVKYGLVRFSVFSLNILSLKDQDLILLLMDSITPWIQICNPSNSEMDKEQMQCCSKADLVSSPNVRSPLVTVRSATCCSAFPSSASWIHPNPIQSCPLSAPICSHDSNSSTPHK